jgi:hypothetical protein
MSRKTWLLVVAACLLTGCAFVFRFPAFTPPASVRPGLYRGAFHVHSTFSHDSKASLDRIISTGERAGLHFVVVADHNTLKGADAYKQMMTPLEPLLIFASEISTDSGHVIALGVSKEPPDLWEAQQVVDWITSQGGTAVAAHPVSPKKPWTRFDLKGVSGLELFSFPDVYYTKNMSELVPKAALRPPRQFLDSVIETPFDALRLWRTKLEQRKMVAFGSVDAHLRWEWGSVAAENYLLYLQAVTTYVYSEELSQEAITEALRRGNSYIAFEARGLAHEFSFTARAAASTHGPGESLSAQSTVAISVKVPQPAAVQLVRDNQIVTKINTDRLLINVTEPGNYYVEVYRDGKIWIISNPITVTPQ